MTVKTDSKHIEAFTAGNYVDSHNYSHYTDYSYDDIGQLKTAKGTDRAYDYQAEQPVPRRMRKSTVSAWSD